MGGVTSRGCCCPALECCTGANEEIENKSTTERKILDRTETSQKVSEQLSKLYVWAIVKRCFEKRNRCRTGNKREKNKGQSSEALAFTSDSKDTA